MVCRVSYNFPTYMIKQREREKEAHIITSPGLLFCFQSYDLLQSGCEMSFE